MIKVAHICTSRISYKILKEKLYEISKLGYNVSIISSTEGEDTNFFKEHGINQYYIEMNRQISFKDDIKSILNMIRLIKSEKFDIVHTHTAKAGFIGRVAARIAGTKVIIHTSHGLPYYSGQNKLRYMMYKSLEVIASRFCDYVGSQNKEDLEKIVKYVDKSKVFYEGNGVNLERLDNISHSINDNRLDKLKYELKIENDMVILLVGARIEKVKNHDLLIEALKILNQNGINRYCCLLAGEGPLEKELREKVKSYNLQDNIRFLGFRKDIYDLIKLSDVVVLTSEKEGIPRILMESMAFEKPIVATNVLGTKELVCNEETGLLSQYPDAKQLSENLSNIIKDKYLREKMGKCGRERIERYFTEDIVAKRLDKLYKESLSI